MAYVAPTEDDLKARFPAFVGVPKPSVVAALADAARQVDETWTEGDYALGRLLYAAHLLTLSGFGPEAKAAGAKASGVSSISSGQLSVTFANGGTLGDTSLSATSYGNRFQTLRRQNVGGAISVT